VWVEAESKRIGRVQLPDALFDAIRGASTVVQMSAPMVERVRLWREDYAHFAADPVAMVERLAHLKPLVGGDTLATWQALAAGGDVDALFERVMVDHYDPCYARSLRHRRDVAPHEVPCALERLDAAALDAALPALLARLRLSG
jgi:tRNA 2-selenouridine synthase